MIHIINNILAKVSLTALLAVGFASCHHDDASEINIDESLPIDFAPLHADQEVVSRAGSATPLASDFTVYGYKTVDNITQLVFNGYNVKYTPNSANTSQDNTHNYSYVQGDQTIKYWDFGASEYHFWGATKVPKDRKDSKDSKDSKDPKVPKDPKDLNDLNDLSDFNFTSGGTILTITGLTLSTSEPTGVPLYTQLYHRWPVSREVVQLRFKRPYAQLRVLFYTTEDIPVGDQIPITDIAFGPDPSAESPLVNKIYAQGGLQISYPLPSSSCLGEAQESVEVIPSTNQDNQRDVLSFADIALTDKVGISSNTAVTAPPAPPAGGGSCYYVLPMGTKNPAFFIRARIDGDDRKEAYVPATFMQWKPNTCYTYIFKITEAGKKITLYDVLIDPWQYGGSQEETWTNW